MGIPLWLDTPDRPAPRPALDGSVEVDLAVVGAGFTGLWTALRAVERTPGTRVIVLEADRIAEHATGRNGGFCEATLTHGEANGRARWPGEYDVLDRMGVANLDAIEETLARYGIECGFARGGALAVATRPHEVADLEPDSPGFLDAEAVRRMVDSPTYLAGRHRAGRVRGRRPGASGLGTGRRRGTAGRADHRGHSRGPDPQGRLRASSSPLRAASSAPARSRWRRTCSPRCCGGSGSRRCRSTTTCSPPSRSPTTSWRPCAGTRRSASPTRATSSTTTGSPPDRRILFGGYDAIYHFGRGIEAGHEERPATYDTLARHLAETFPQLGELRFSHRWAGVIDTSTRFCAFYGSTHGGRTAYALGFTGLGVGASRFAADVMLDLLAGEDTERTRLEMVRTKPLPFPPEPLAWVGIQLTRWSLARADATGRRNLWLRLLDRLGLGFDS